MARNDLGFVRDVLALLSDQEVHTWVFGGWAEELLGIASPRDHKDVDLLFPAEDFALVDAVIRDQGLDEIEGKRLSHKRAFVLEGVMVELFLVQRDQRGMHTKFRGEIRHDWPADLLAVADGLPVASASAVLDYRRTVHPSRDGLEAFGTSTTEAGG